MVQGVTATILLETWEQTYSLGQVERGLALLGLARPQESLASLAGLPIGERDAALLDLRAILFGPDIQSLDSCPECDEQIEVSFAVDDIRVERSSQVERAEIEVGGRPVSIRAATSSDLIAVERAATPGVRRNVLLNRCVSRMDAESGAVGVSELPESDLQVIAGKLAELDPQADVRMALDCVRCGHVWSSRFDIATFLWSEINAWAQRLLAEVHTLAFAYGWAERDVIRMPSYRRQIYLGMLRR